MKREKCVDYPEHSARKSSEFFVEGHRNNVVAGRVVYLKAFKGNTISASDVKLCLPSTNSTADMARDSCPRQRKALVPEFS